MTLPERVVGLEMPVRGPLVDAFGRRHTYLRASVTDRCNYRCVYCLPATGVKWLPRNDLLTFEELTRVIRILSEMGVERIRLTGGEPTVRRGIEELVGMVAELPGVREVSMTTNGHLFADKAEALARAGLSRVNVSLDTLDPTRFRRMTRGGDLARVLAAIEAAREAGLTPVKVNAVIVAGQNDAEVEDIVSYFARWPDAVQVRFIETMPFSGATGRTHVPARALRKRLGGSYTLEPLSSELGGGPATHVRLRETGQIVGFISPITEHFCQSCNRLRLSADGHLRSCLSREPEPSLRVLVRAGLSDDELALALRRRVWQKVAGHEAHLADGWKSFEGVMTQIGG